MLVERYAHNLPRLLAPRDCYHPFPTVEERAGWEGLSSEGRAAAIAEAERRLGYQYPALPAALYMDFKRTGERRPYEEPYFARRSALASLVLGECVEGKGRFLDDIGNGIWAICEESTWVIPAHNEPQGGPDDALPEMLDPYLDLFSGETGALLAWTHYLLRPRLNTMSRRLCPRIEREVKARILDPFLGHDDFWWMGLNRGTHWLNNWSPWCSSTCLTAFLVLEEDETRRAAAVMKAMGIVDRWLATYHPDGGCDEGPSYWTVAGGALCDCLQLLSSATHGAINSYDEPLIQEMGRYIYRAHISGDHYLDFADCPGKVHLPADLVYRYGRRIGDEKMAALGAWAHQRRGSSRGRSGSLLRALPSFFFTEGIEEPANPPHVRDVWLDGIQVMAAREQEGSDRGLYLAAKGGHNEESHNHNDVGQFLVYCDGQPVLVDVGVGTYTRQTFSAQRYEIWTMQSAYHNLPTVNGVQQRDGREFRAEEVTYHADEAGAEISLDLAAAYPREAGIRTWRRTCRLARGTETYVEIEEAFVLEAETGEIALSLMTPCEARVEQGAVLMRGQLPNCPEYREEASNDPIACGVRSVAAPVRGNSVAVPALARLTYDTQALIAEVETIALEDPRLREAWGEMHRVVLKARGRLKEGVWRVRVERLGNREQSPIPP